MTASIRILTTASLDSNPSLLIISPDGSKTLINCGEGCQRSFLESASRASADVGTLRISSVNRVCLTHIGHDSLGGLPGMILTTADVVDTVTKEMKIAAKKNDDNNKKMMSYNRKRNSNGSLISNNNSNNSNDDDDNEGDGMPDLEIVGPVGINTFLHSLRHFMRRDRFKVHTHEGQYDSSQNKHNVSSAKKSKGKKRKKKGSDNAALDNNNGFNVKSIPISYNATHEYPQNYDSNDTSIQSLPPIMKQAVSYLFNTPPIPGKFRIDKALKLNVPRGPMYAQLKSGKSVTFVDTQTNEERTVTSEEVVDECSPGVGVAIVYCPNLDVLEELKVIDTFVALEKKIDSAKNGEEVGDTNPNKEEQKQNDIELDVMVHFTPQHIFDKPVYQSWLKRFGTTVDHITLHTMGTLEERAALEDENSPFITGICGGIRRSYVNDTLFPIPLPILQQSTAVEEVDVKQQTEEKANDDISIIKSCSMMDYVLMPRSRRGLNESTVKSLYTNKLMDKLKQQVKESGAIERASSILSSTDDEKEDQTQFRNSSCVGELIFTGTGSAVPCKHRNVTGKYLRMNNGNAMLLDVGEGTVGQLLRSWKSTLRSSSTAIDEYRSRIRGIKAVWISHPHADHHLGLLRLLSERAAVCGESNDPIVLMAPHDLYDFLQEYQLVVPEIKRSYIFVESYDMIHNGRGNPLGRRLYDTLGITNCVSIPVAHCMRSYAVVIDGTSFGKVSYSGDCRPSNRFADVGYGSDLLIHEATFEDGMEEDAVLKRHSTVGEAMDVASKMNAKSLVLTHFSQRYPKIPPLNQPKEGDRRKEIPISFAFDFMKLTPNTIELAAQLTPALRLLYSDEEADESEVTVEKTTAAKELMAVPGVFAAKSVL